MSRALTLVGLFLATALTAQEQRPAGPVKPEAQITAMKRLDYMAGDWRGEGWMDFGGRRATFRGSEVVQSKLGGTVLLVEGNFLSKVPGAETEVPVHTTLAVMSYDPGTQKYNFHSWLATGTSGVRELVVSDKGWEWEMSSPRGKIRYRMTLGENGEWIETGERSTDGTKWTQFFEMRLKK